MQVANSLSCLRKINKWNECTPLINSSCWEARHVACTYFGEIADVRKPNLSLVEAMTGSHDFPVCPER